MKQKLKEMYKQALKEKNESAKLSINSVLGMIAAEEKAIHLKEKNERDLTETEIINIIQKEIKIYNESYDEAKKANRENLMEEALTKIKILQQVLPEMLSEEEALRIAMSFIDENNLDTSNVKIMNQSLRPVLNGKVEKQVINKVINSLITK